MCRKTPPLLPGAHSLPWESGSQPVITKGGVESCERNGRTMALRGRARMEGSLPNPQGGLRKEVTFTHRMSELKGRDRVVWE